MKLSFTTMATPTLSGTEAVKIAKKYGYDGVDLRVSDYMGELKLDSTPEDVYEIKNALAAEGIKPASLLCYNDTGTSEPDSWEKMTDSILRHIEISTVLGFPAIRIFGGEPGLFQNPEKYIEKTADAISRALLKSGNELMILIQNHEGGYSAKDAAQLADKVNSRRFGIVFSPDHCVIMRELLSEVYSWVTPFTKQIYIADLRIKDNKHISVLPGKGCVPLKEVYTALGGDRFDGWLTFKWEKLWNPELEEPEIALPYFIDYIGEIMST